MVCEKFGSCPDQERFHCRIQDVHPSLPSCVRIRSERDVHLVRRHAMQRAEMLGMSSLDGHYVATAVSELANNLVFHAEHGGVIQFFHVEKHGRCGIEVVALDDGPGIADIEQAMQDGFSTGGGLGSGLGGVQRLMDDLEVCSERGSGTRIVTRKWAPA